MFPRTSFSPPGSSPEPHVPLPWPAILVFSKPGQSSSLFCDPGSIKECWPVSVEKFLMFQLGLCHLSPIITKMAYSLCHMKTYMVTCLINMVLYGFPA